MRLFKLNKNESLTEVMEAQITKEQELQHEIKYYDETYQYLKSLEREKLDG